MNCANPFIRGTQVFGCGSCVPCLINRRRIWTLRLMVEAMLQSDNAFVTLTYDDQHLPEGGVLVPRDMQLWLKRLRTALSPKKFRFYGVGEYGETSQRPHYHVLLFGYASCAYGMSSYSERRKSCCVQCDRVRDTWGKGNVFLGELNQETCQYTARYVMKKSAKGEMQYMSNYPKEFSRQSTRPGIGAGMIAALAKVSAEYGLDDDDVPSQLRIGEKVWPLGRYLMRKLRKELGREEGAPQAVIDKIAEELRPMFEAAKASKEVPGVKAHIVEAGSQRRRQIEVRRSIFEKKGKL